MKAQRSTYVRYCQSAIDTLNTQYEKTKVITHRASAGAAREALIREFLTAHMPEMTSAVSGLLMDASGGRSKQQDIVFLLKTYPRLPFSSGFDLIYVEGVVATIEIKTRTNADSWKTISDNIASVRSLRPNGHVIVKIGDLLWDHSQVFTSVVTYDGPPLVNVEKSILRLPENGRPHVYLDLRRGMLVSNMGALLPLASTGSFISILDPGQAFAQYLIFLTRITSSMVLRAIDWEAYMA